MTERFMHIPGRRAETSKLIERLKSGKPGDRVTDAELSAIAGADTSPSGGGYGWLQSAIATCVRDHSVVWQRVRHAGYLECLDADRLEKVGKGSLRSIRKKARVTSRRLVCADLTSATPEVKQGLMMTLAQLGAIHNAAGPKAISAAPANQLDLKKLVESMRE